MNTAQSLPSKSLPLNRTDRQEICIQSPTHVHCPKYRLCLSCNLNTNTPPISDLHVGIMFTRKKQQ